MADKGITLGYSSHRPETLPFAADHMGRHQVAALEEAAISGFEDMLSNRLSIEEYLIRGDFEFPVFARRSCELLRELHKKGMIILQVDPFMEVLREIHESFSAGGSPQGIEMGGIMHDVYEAERKWGAALLDFYKVSMRGSFDDIVAKVKAFARADAARGRLLGTVFGPRRWQIGSYPCMNPSMSRRVMPISPFCKSFSDGSRRA